MMTLLELCALAFVAVTALILLRDASAPHPELLVVCFALAVLVRICGGIAEVVAFTGELTSGTDVAEHLSILLKGAGIAYLSDFTASICRDSGQGRVGDYVELAARTELTLLALPIISQLLELSFGMMGL